MPLDLQYTALVGLGLVSGYVAHRLVMSRRDSFRHRLRLNRQLDGLAAVPGAMLVVFLAQRFSQSPTPGWYLRFGAAFLLPYTMWRVVTDYSLKRAAKGREGTLAFEVWYELLGKTPGKAHEFIESYLAQEARLMNVGAQVRELQTACQLLEQSHASDASLPGALAVLRGHIARLEQESVRSLGSSPS